MVNRSVQPAGPALAGVVFEYDSYLDLVAKGDIPITASPVPFDIIVVPAGRPVTSFASAVRLAQEADAPLVVLCSKHAKATDVAKELAAYDKLVWYAVDLPSEYTHPLLSLTASSVIAQAGLLIDSDISIKRNIGLLLGKALGDRVLFLDDDISLQLSGVSEAAALLSRYSIVGFDPDPAGFPDNSVVVHASRALEKLCMPHGPARISPMKQHVSGGRMAVNLRSFTSHFPECVYDEDWLYMYDALERRDIVMARATSWQAVYDPFATSERAAHEEFGNTISKGLYDNLRVSDRSPLVSEQYWRDILDGRKKRLHTVYETAEMCLAHADEPATVRRIMSSLQAAAHVNRLITPDLCVAYYRAWHLVDTPEWSARFTALPDAMGIQQMLNRLELSHYTVSNVTGRL